MTSNQSLLLNWLKGDRFYTPTEIGRGVWNLQYNSSKACQVVKGLVAMGLVEKNEKGWYRRIVKSEAKS